MMETSRTSNARESPPRRKAKPSRFDGTRVKVIKKNGQVALVNRHGIDYTHRLTELVDAAEAIKGDFTIDTEAVFINPATKEVEFTPCQT